MFILHLIIPYTLHRREKLAGLLWPDSDATKARSNLRQTLWRLRHAVGEEYFVADKLTIAFSTQANYKLDVATLEDAAADARTADDLMRSVSVYEGRLLSGYYDDWILLEGKRFEAVFGDRMQSPLDRLIEEARWREIREWAERLIALGQVPEQAYRALMMAHASLGNQASVAAVFQRCVKTLDEEIGVEPAAETRGLFQRLTSGEELPGAQPRPTVNLPLHPTCAGYLTDSATCEGVPGYPRS